MLKKVLGFALTATVASAAVFPLGNLPTINSATDSAFQIATSPDTYIVVEQAAGDHLCFDPQAMLNQAVATMDTSVANYYNSTVTKSNSFGSWVFFDSQNGGYGAGDELTNRRSSSPINFRFSVLSNGKLQVKISRTNWSTVSVESPLPVPMDQWVYIQAYQSGNNYSVGWQTANGTQSVASKNMSSLITNNPNTYNFDISLPANATHTFWGPGTQMFAEMNNADISAKDVSSMSIVDYTTSAFLNDLWAGIFPAIADTTITQDMLDIYTDNSNIIVVDLRNRTCTTPLPPLF